MAYLVNQYLNSVLQKIHSLYQYLCEIQRVRRQKLFSTSISDGKIIQKLSEMEFVELEIGSRGKHN